MTAADDHNRLLRPAELSLGAVMIATVLGFSRLFEGGDFVLPLTISAVAAHLVPALGRRWAWGLPRTAMATFVAFALSTSWLFYLGTTFIGIPTTATFTTARADLVDAWETFQEVVAPAPAETGFLVALCFAVWLAAFLADWAAFRLWSTFEAIVPSATLFIFASMIGSSRLRLLATLLYLGAALGFLLVHRVAKQEDATSWLGAEAANGSSVMLRSGAALCAGAVAVALLVGPQLPGVDEEAIWDPGGAGSGDGSRVTLSPIVDIKKRIVEQSDLEVFTVRSPERAYWRLTSLDTFDGSIWKSRGDFESAAGTLPATIQSTAPRQEATQQVVIKALDALWLPAAYEPTSIDPGGADVVYEAESTTLIVGSDRSTSDGLVYEVESALPRLDRAALEAAPSTVPVAVADRYLDLPDDFSSMAADAAAEITAGLDHPYQKAMALQAFFQDNFDYSTDIRGGHGVDAIDEFLTTRIGFCEQFAGTYAAMARSVGLPARVAIGFTPGEVDPIDPELFHVRGEHAHAWPEVYIEGFGWVAFEPTVSRGIPNAESYTDVPEPAEPAADDSPDTESTSTTSVGAVPQPTVPEGNADDFAGLTETTGEDPDDPSGGLAERVAIVVLVALVVAVLLAGLYAVGVGAAAARVRHNRRRRAIEDRDRVDAAWAEALEALAVAGRRPRPDETQSEFMARVPADWGIDRGLLSALGEAAAAASYAAEGPSTAQADRADEAAEAIEAVVPLVTSRRHRWAAALDPRPLLPRRRPRLVTDRTTVRPQPL